MLLRAAQEAVPIRMCTCSRGRRAIRYSRVSRPSTHGLFSTASAPPSNLFARSFFQAWNSTEEARARSVFHHFPITGNLVLVKCRQFSVLGLTRGSLGSSRSAIELRPLDINSYSRIPSQYSGLSDVV